MRYVVLFAVSVVMLFLAVFGEKGVLQIFRLTSAKIDARQRLITAGADIVTMKRERDSLKGDRQVMERMARLNFGLALPNEVVYIIERPQPAASASGVAD